ncbi:2-hydroxyacid dehydrogenase [Francisella adeliensis]|uniref:Hydroxyacid dehydrogenase n=1 Tax=Francisella adeliensis TaxID=2007306 RepID=A0A2Z4XWM7_9GAMM|nr:2-hydroxyacid dehydrogenase [Francisella adeliensis]AXA32902.1 hydroxyacid dehydrogenase [Francisella adeliensis]MBK2086401.1 2-hydroxyacid dehydrogenase [Francisella adeliensis]MBK2096616.1 2-hydroxyacid dehydrogenase [Francisella adeliensis]QIW11128.1 2-hydroxyacid dehydrogenase [Francisella adeliensis]QIW13005.1 2-hydroxyacid dehydrogenase [Francisella adeliensis]
MKILFYSTKKYDKEYFTAQNNDHTLEFSEYGLNEQTADFAKDFDAVCIFVNDICDANVIDKLHSFGIKAILLRCAGFNNVAVEHAKKLGIKIARVPAYSPFSVAEHTLALLLCLNRKIHKAYNRVRESNFNIEGLEGFDIHQKTIGIVGFGNIGKAFAQIMSGFGGEILVHDPFADKNASSNVKFVELDELFEKADIISLHCPLNDATKYIIDENALDKIKSSAIIINTSRGALIDSKYIIKALKHKAIAGLAIDVYEYEKDIFFKDMSAEIIDDDIFERLLTFPNVLVTAHQAFLTKEALNGIARTTLNNASTIETGSAGSNLL